MTSIENHETSYENGQRPYKHDDKRGKWEKPADFFFACLNNSFTTTHFSSMMYVFFLYNDSLLITFLYYLFTIAIYAVPMMFIQSFLGQFSSSGYISVFRIAPFFKGLGYVILLLNFMVLTYAVIFAAVPMFYALSSVFSVSSLLECANNTWNTPNCSALTLYLDYDINIQNYDDYQKYKQLPSYEFYSYHLGIFSDCNGYSERGCEQNKKDAGLSFNWSIFGCSLVVWGIVYLISIKDIDWVGKISRYITLGLIGGLLVITLTSLSTKQLITNLANVFDLSHIRADSHLLAFMTSPMICLQIFGRGWGTTLVLASHNNFKANVSNLSLAVVISKALITTACMFITTVLFGILDSNVDRFHLTFDHPLEGVYVGYPAVFGLMKFPRFYLFLLFTMISTSEILEIVMQLKALFVSFFDEFHEFRWKRQEIIMGVVGFFVFTTTFYCSNHGFSFFRTMSYVQIAMQALIFLHLILIVMWIYGKDRLQRDIYFMLHIKYPTYVVNIVRFVAPIFLFITLLYGFVMTLSPMGKNALYELIAALIIKLLPWIIIPGYMIYSLMKATGPLLSKFSKLNRPTDWYPVEIDDRQKYETALGNSDISHQLSVTIVEENGLCEEDED
ncbi:hypothetical protein ACFFRR_004859 [Megaselia abdita]